MAIRKPTDGDASCGRALGHLYAQVPAASGLTALAHWFTMRKFCRLVAPHRLCRLDHEIQFSALRVMRNIIADDRRSEAALRAESQTLQRNVTARFR